jgi:hypothetical protein
VVLAKRLRPGRAAGFRSTKQPAELRFHALLTDGAQEEEVRFERVAVGST